MRPLTFDANDGAGTMAAQKLPGGLSAALTANGFTREGYAFAGWNTVAVPTAEDPGMSYADTEIVSLTEDTTLYAQWESPATAPTITAQPQDLSLTYGNTQGYLTVGASAAEGHTLSYQWYSNTSASSEGGTKLGGETYASYAVLGDRSAGSYYYYCVVTATREDNSRAATAVSSVATVTVAPKSLTAEMVNVVVSEHDYNGSGKRPNVVVKDANRYLTLNRDYTVSYADNTDPGTATVMVTGKGNYPGTVSKTFRIYGVKGAWADGKLTATAHVKEPANALLIAAVYDGNGKQVSVKVIPLEAGKTSYETGVTAKTSGYTYKLMVVSKSSFAPLCAAWSEKVS